MKHSTRDPFIVAAVVTTIVFGPVVSRVPRADTDPESLNDHARELPQARGWDASQAFDALDAGAGGKAREERPFTGLAEPIRVDPLYGTAATSIPIEIPPGRKGMAPSLRLAYSSTGKNSPFGKGWSLDIGAIERRTDFGVPIDLSTGAYLDSAGFLLRTAAGSVVLDAPVADSSCTGACARWGSLAEETWVDARFNTSANQWVVVDKSGIRYVYGAITAARVGKNVNQSARTFRWQVSSATDPNGNTINYSYVAVPDVDPGAQSYAYLDLIEYGANPSAGLATHPFHVRLVYENASRPLFLSFLGGFAELALRRLQAIKVWVSHPGGSDNGTESSPNKAYAFSYVSGKAGDSLLSSVSLDAGVSLPATTFTYTTADHAFSNEVPLDFVTAGGTPVAPHRGCNDAQATENRYALSAICGSKNEDNDRDVARVMSGFVDVNGDGLVDYVDGLDGFERVQGGLYPEGGHRLEAYLNRGNGTFVYDGVLTTLSPGSLSDLEHTLIDIDGDGEIEVLQNRADPTFTPGCENYWPNPPSTCTWQVWDDLSGTPTARAWPGVASDLRYYTPESGEFRGGYSPQSDSFRLRAPPSVLMDLNGDDLPDVLDCCWDWDGEYTGMPRNVFDSGCTGSGAGYTTWTTGDKRCRLYLNTGAGFAGMQRYIVPEARQCNAYDQGPIGQNDEQACTNANRVNFNPLEASWNRFDGNTGGRYYTEKLLEDMNGDGLPDIVRRTTSHILDDDDPTPLGGIEVWWNRGGGFAKENEAESWGASAYTVRATTADTDYSPNTDILLALRTVRFDAAGTNDQDQLQTTTALVDMNADGRPDLVTMEGALASKWLVYWNQGSAFSTTPTMWNQAKLPLGTAAFYGATGSRLPLSWIQRIDKGPNRADHQGADHVMSALLDLNGDGLPDYAWRDKTTGEFWARYSTGVPSDLLEGIENGIGGSWTASYVSSNEADDGVATGIWTVSQTTASGGSAGGPEVVADFRFQDGVYDYTEKTFRGYRYSEEERGADGRINIREYATPDDSALGALVVPLPLRPIRVATADGATVLRESTTDWAAVATGDGRARVHPTREVQYRHGSGPSIALTKQLLTYDAYNNLTSWRVSGSGIDEPTTTTTEYTASGDCHASPTKETVRDDLGRVLSIETQTYNNQCNLRRVRAHLAPSGAFVNEGQHPAITLQEFFYDSQIDAFAAASGQPTRIQDGNGNETTIYYSSASADHYGLYPAVVTRDAAPDHVVATTYDLEHGLVRSIVDQNGAETTFDYDGIGRITEEARPLDSLPYLRVARELGTTDAPSRVIRSVRESASEDRYLDGYTTSAVFSDGLGRTLQSQVEAVVHGAYEITVIDSVAYDGAGRVLHRASPAKATTSNVQLYAPGGATGTSYGYDALDRVAAETNPDGTERRTAYDVPPGSTFTTDENFTLFVDGLCASRPSSCPGRGVVSLADFADQVLQEELYEGGALIRRTENDYDSRRRLVRQTTRSPSGATHNAVVTYEYDSLDRQTALVDPDSGRWEFDYDAAGNKIHENDPKAGQHLELIYDSFNRLRVVCSRSGDDYVGGVCPTPSVRSTYTYDLFSNSIGRLNVQAGYDGSGAKTFEAQMEYDFRGRTIEQRNLYYSGFGTPLQLATELVYDESDHIASVVYPPDATGYRETVTYAYNSAGRPIAAESDTARYVTNASYDRFGRAEYVEQGGGGYQLFDYSENAADNFRLRSLYVGRGLEVLQQLDYGPYDAAGRILEVTDRTLLAPAPLGARSYPGNAELVDDWVYGYDGLGRLTSATRGSLNLSSSYAYDFLENMTSGATYDVADAAVTTLSFNHDTNGQPHQIATMSASPGQSGALVIYEDGGANASGNGGLRWRPVVGDDTWLSVDYDSQRRVSAVTAGAVVTESYYDADGRRRVRLVDDLEWTVFDTYYTYDGGGLTRQIWFDGGIVALSRTEPGESLVLSRACKLKVSGDKRKLSCSAKSRNALRKPADHGAGWYFSPSASIDEDGVTLPIEAIAWSPPAATEERTARFTLNIDGRRVGCTDIVATVTGEDRQDVYSDAGLGRIRESATIKIGPSTPLHVTIDAPSCNGKKIRFSLQIKYSGGATPTPSPDEVIYLARDRLDSTILATSYYGEPRQYYRYGPYGETEVYDAEGNAVATGGELTELLYTGQRRDSASGLYYYNARFYDPVIARFLTHDPARELINPYAYVAWTPTNANDPTGQYVDIVIDVAILAANIYITAGAWQAGNATLLDKVLDVGALTIDAAATVAPFVPAFAGNIRTGIYVARAGQAAELSKTANKTDALLDGGQAAKREAGSVDYVFRGDARDPSTIFEGGFSAKGSSTDVFAHALDNNRPPSAFVSTSKSAEVAASFGENVYVLRPRGGIDVNAVLGPRSPFPNELEVAVPWRVAPTDIRGVTLPGKGVSILNPDWVP